MIEKVLKRVIEIVSERSRTNAFDDNWIFKVEDIDKPRLLEYKIVSFSYEYNFGTRIVSGWKATVVNPSIAHSKTFDVDSSEGWSRCPMEAFRHCLRKRLNEADQALVTLWQTKTKILEHEEFFINVKNDAVTYGYLTDDLVKCLLRSFERIEKEIH